jgi:single-strand DNA-binding protein
MKNRVQLIGHVGQPPELKKLETGKIANFSFATNDNFTNAKGEKVTQTEWHRITVWNKTAEFAMQYLHKGTQVALEGKLTHKSYEDKEGNKRFITEIVVTEIVLLGGCT